MSPNEASDGDLQIAFRDKMSGDRELVVVTETSGAANSGTEQKNNRKGETSNPCDYDRSLFKPAFLSSPEVGLVIPEG